MSSSTGSLPISALWLDPVHFQASETLPDGTTIVRVLKHGSRSVLYEGRRANSPVIVRATSGTAPWHHSESVFHDLSSIVNEPVNLVLHEAKVLERLDGRGAPQLLATGIHRAMDYLVQEWSPGLRLDRVDESNEGAWLAIYARLAECLGAAHAAGVVHRDFKPGNVLVELSGARRLTIVDWGLALLDGEGVAGPVGTSLYRAPEQWMQESGLGPSVDGRADLYSMGIGLFEALAGTPPFTRGSKIRSDHLLSAPHWPETLSPHGRACLTALLAKEPELRVATGVAAAALLRDDSSSSYVETTARWTTNLRATMQAVDAHPDDVQRHTALAVLTRTLGLTDIALQAVGTAKLLDPEDQDVELELARCQAEAGFVQEAAATALRLTHVQPTEDGIALLWSLGQLEAAQAGAQRLSAEEKTGSSAWQLLVRSALQALADGLSLPRLWAVVAHGCDALGLEGHATAAWEAVGVLRARDGQRSRDVRSRPPPDSSHAGAIKSLLAAGEPHAAFVAFEGLMSDLSERAAQLPEMTGFLLRFGDNASALGVADSAFRAAPADSCLLGWRSLALVLNGRPEAALDDAEAAIALASECSPAWATRFLLAELLHLSQSDRDAAFDRATLAPWTLPEVWIRGASEKLLENDPHTALIRARWAVFYAPDYIGAWQALALAAVALGSDGLAYHAAMMADHLDDSRNNLDAHND